MVGRWTNLKVSIGEVSNPVIDVFDNLVLRISEFRYDFEVDDTAKGGLTQF